MKTKVLMGLVTTFGFLLMLSSCNSIITNRHVNDINGTGTGGSSSAKEITSFSILDIQGTIKGTDISITVPFGTDLSSLAPIIVYKGISISLGSGVTHDFRSPVHCIVTAADGTAIDYLVTIKVAASDEKDITRFALAGVEGIIDESAQPYPTISIRLPFGTNVSLLPPSITYTGVSIYPSASEAQDFRNDLSFIVTAADKTMKVYTVLVYVALSNTADINVFALAGVQGTIDESALPNPTITVLFPHGTDLSSLAPTTLIYDGASISPLTASDFRVPVTYVVTAADGVTTRSYTVIATASLCTDPSSNIYYVRPSGSDSTGTGSTDCPYRSIQVAIDKMIDMEVSGEVHIAAGIYEVTDPVQIEGGISVLGGYNNDWSDRKYLTDIDREDVAYKTVVKYVGTNVGDFSGMSPSHAIRASGADITPTTLLEGLTISAQDVGDFTTGILAVNDANPKISYNTIGGSSGAGLTTAIFSLSSGYIDHNKIYGGDSIVTSCGIGLIANNAIVEYNTINGGTASDPASGTTDGICAMSSSGLQISSNVINGGTASSTFGINFDQGVTGTIQSNTIDAGDSVLHSFGISMSNSSSPTIINNVITGGTSTNYSDDIFTDLGAAPIIRNNTLIAGTTGVSLNGLCMWDNSGAVVFENNIVYTGSSTPGLAIHVQPASPNPLSIKNNDIYGSFQCLYFSASGCLSSINELNNNYPFASDNISVDPSFADPSSLDFHLTSTTDAAVGLGGKDLSAFFSIDKDGVTRTVPFSMGAYQPSGISYPVGQTLSTPTISPPGGMQAAGTQITITSAEGGTIRYTMGTSPADPTITDTVYNPGIKPAMGGSAMTIKAKAFKIGYLPSAVASASYTSPLIPVTLVLKMVGGSSIVSCGGPGTPPAYCTSPPFGLHVDSGSVAQFRAVFIDTTPLHTEIPYILAGSPSIYYSWSTNGSTTLPVNQPTRLNDNTFVIPSDVGGTNTMLTSGSFWMFSLTASVGMAPDGYTLSGSNQAMVVIGLYESDVSSVQIAPVGAPGGPYHYSQRIMYASNRVGAGTPNAGMSNATIYCQVDGGSWSTTCPKIMLDLASDTNPHTLWARACPCNPYPSTLCNTVCSLDTDYIYSSPTPATYACSDCNGGLVANNLSASASGTTVTGHLTLLSQAINPWAGVFTDINCSIGPVSQLPVFPATPGAHTVTLNGVPAGTYYFSVVDQGFQSWGHMSVRSRECVPVIY